MVGETNTKFVSKEFISPIDKASTATIVCFYGSIINFDGDLEEGGFLELSDCRRKIRLHMSIDHSKKEYIEIIRKIERNCKEFGDFLESIAPD